MTSLCLKLYITVLFTLKLHKHRNHWYWNNAVATSPVIALQKALYVVTVSLQYFGFYYEVYLQNSMKNNYHRGRGLREPSFQWHSSTIMRWPSTNLNQSHRFEFMVCSFTHITIYGTHSPLCFSCIKDTISVCTDLSWYRVSFYPNFMSIYYIKILDFVRVRPLLFKMHYVFGQFHINRIVRLWSLFPNLSYFTIYWVG